MTAISFPQILFMEPFSLRKPCDPINNPVFFLKVASVLNIFCFELVLDGMPHAREFT